MVKKLLLLLLSILTSLPDVLSLRPKVVHVRSGELVVLHCPLCHDAAAKPLWTSHTTQEKNLTNNMSASADPSQTDVLIHGHSLVILRVTVNHQGNFSCSLRNSSSQFWFRLRVYTTNSREYEEKSQYLTTCYTQESCTLFCPAENVPPKDTPNITRQGVTWYKEGETFPVHDHFSSPEEKDSGVYTCIRSYLYKGQIYNTSRVVVLDIQPSKQYGQSVILSPRQGDVFSVDLGSAVVIECKSLLYSDFDEVFWLSETSFVENNDSLPVYYNDSRTENTDEINMTASLVFRSVSEDDMLKNYTCKLESDHQLSTFVTITLTRKAHSVSQSSSLRLALCIVGIMMIVIILATIMIRKFKINNVAILQNTFCCDDSSSSSTDPEPAVSLPQNVHSSDGKPDLLDFFKPET